MDPESVTPPVLILDGGLGTTLEDLFHRDISTPLWSARPIEDEPQVLIEAHLAFLRAGARIISTATYQCAYSTFERAGYSRSDGVRIMRKAVAIARSAKERFLAERQDLTSHDVQIALSLGPYGGALEGMKEFDGMYPPPYGPPVPAGTPPRNTFAPEEEELLEQSIEALKAFYLERLRVFMEDEETWDAIDWIAFETVPLGREITAIRRAMRVLEEELTARTKAANSTHPQPQTRRKRWWIATVHSSRGNSPDGVTGNAENATVTMKDLVPIMLRQDPQSALPVPDAIGINCTDYNNLSKLVKEIYGPVREHVLQARQPRPWLVMYPNGRSWVESEQVWKVLPEHPWSWAEAIAKSIEPCAALFGGIIVGGCCKAGPEEIAALATRFSTNGAD